MLSTLLGTIEETIEASHTHSLALRNLPSGWGDKTYGQETLKQQYEIVRAQMFK